MTDLFEWLKKESDIDNVKRQLVLFLEDSIQSSNSKGSKAVRISFYHEEDGSISCSVGDKIIIDGFFKNGAGNVTLKVGGETVAKEDFPVFVNGGKDNPKKITSSVNGVADNLSVTFYGRYSQ